MNKEKVQEARKFKNALHPIDGNRNTTSLLHNIKKKKKLLKHGVKSKENQAKKRQTKVKKTYKNHMKLKLNKKIFCKSKYNGNKRKSKKLNENEKEESIGIPMGEVLNPKDSIFHIVPPEEAFEAGMDITPVELDPNNIDNYSVLDFNYFNVELDMSDSTSELMYLVNDTAYDSSSSSIRDYLSSCSQSGSESQQSDLESDLMNNSNTAIVALSDTTNYSDLSITDQKSDPSPNISDLETDYNSNVINIEDYLNDSYLSESFLSQTVLNEGSDSNISFNPNNVISDPINEIGKLNNNISDSNNRTLFPSNDITDPNIRATYSSGMIDPNIRATCSNNDITGSNISATNPNNVSEFSPDTDNTSTIIFDSLLSLLNMGRSEISEFARNNSFYEFDDNVMESENDSSADYSDHMETDSIAKVHLRSISTL